MADKMEEEGGSGAAGGVKSGGLNIDIHPLVIINISDHTTRKRSLAKGKATRVLGILLGIQEGRDVEICNSFELDYKIVNGAIKLDTEYLEVKREQYKKVFAKYEPLGWYSNSTGKVPQTGEALPGDIDIHKQVSEHFENPLYLNLDTSQDPSVRELPMQIFEGELHVIDDSPTFTLARSSYKLKTEDAERISVDQVSRLNDSGAGSSALSSHLLSVHSAIDMLKKRIAQIVVPLKAMQEGNVPKDHNLLRQVQSLCNRLPAVDTREFHHELADQQRDALLVAYLAAMTKGTHATNEVTDKYNMAYERQSRRRGLF